MKFFRNSAPLFALLFALLTGLPAAGASCSVSATGVALGAYTPNQVAPVDAAGRITVNCAASAGDALPMNVAYSLAMNRGGAAAFSPREMASGGNRLRYHLYQDALRLSLWGDGSGGTVITTGALPLQPSPGVASISHSIYGRIFAAQNAVPGAYADSIVVTISY